VVVINGKRSAESMSARDLIAKEKCAQDLA